MSLRERAIAAYEQHELAERAREASEAALRQAKAALQESERQGEIRAFCLERLGQVPDRIDCEDAFVDGIRLQYVRYGDGAEDRWLQLLGACPGCGELVAHDECVDDLVSLGRVLAGPFVATSDHVCPGRPPTVPPTRREKATAEAVTT